MLKRRIDQLETWIVKLRAHTEKGTCPRDLRYVAKAYITPDEEFERNTLQKERGRTEIHKPSNRVSLLPR